MTMRGEVPAPGARLSKSRYVAGLQCKKMLWWKVHESDAAKVVGAPDVLIVRGNRVGELARAYVPGGVLIDLPQSSRLAASAPRRWDRSTVRRCRSRTATGPPPRSWPRGRRASDGRRPTAGDRVVGPLLHGLDVEDRQLADHLGDRGAEAGAERRRLGLALGTPAQVPWTVIVLQYRYGGATPCPL
jgi:hypothetical protein